MLVFASCGDVDVSEVVTEDYTFARDDADTAVSDETAVSENPSSGSSMHLPGQRRASTNWFFHQPWAARAYWYKLVRDAIFLLVIAVLITFFTRRKGSDEI